MGTLTAERWHRVQDVLNTFDDLPPTERAGFLETTRRNDPDLGRYVEALLEHDDKLDSFLTRPLFPVCSENLDDAVLVPRIGPYRLTRELGEGGMGSVYLAIQEEPFKRRVALKLIQPEILNPETVRRFESERQILAGIRHPNVAHLYDGGTTPGGRPYFVMEYVEGEPIEEYCDAHQLSTRERLELFLQVCSAVQLAHQKLRVVHRDLKPGNILVTADGVPKLLDFGIAKRLDAEPRLPGPIDAPPSVWAPYYSSPEQLSGQPLTTASDIFSLGVLLYRLLTGRLPYRLETADSDAVRQAIGEQTPQKPSVVVLRAESRVENGTPTHLTPQAVSGDRAGNPAKLRRRLAGDLDAIVLKTLAKKPESRYSSVERLSEDIRRHLEGLPVLARKPTPLYRAGKFVRRYRLPLAAAAVLVLLACGLILDQAREIAQVRRVSGSLVGLLKALQPATPDQKIELEGALEKAAHIIDDPMFAGHSLDQALLMDALGRAYTSLGHYDPAEDLLENALETRRRVLGKDHLLVAESLHNLAFLYENMGDVARAEDHLRRSLRIRYRSSETDVGELSKGINSQAILLYDRGYYGEAEALFRRVIDMRQRLYGEEHPDVVRARSNLAAALVEQGVYNAAEALYRQNLEFRSQLHGAEHNDVANSRNYLATVLYAQNKLEAAEAEAREALRILRQVHGPEHPRVALALNNLGMILQSRGALGDAEAAYLEALAIFRQQLRDDHLYVAVTRRNLAAVLTAKGDPEAAEAPAAQALDTLRATMAPGSWRIADAESVYASCLAAMGRFAEAEGPLKRSFEVIREARGEWTPYTRDAARRLVDFYEAWGRPEAADAYRRAAAARSPGREEEG